VFRKGGVYGVGEEGEGGEVGGEGGKLEGKGKKED